MLHIIVGGDTKSRTEARRGIWKGALEELNPEFSAEELASLAGTPTLTNEVHGFFIRNALSERIDFLAIAKGLADSVHTFIFEEEKVLTKPREALTKAGAKVEMLASAKEKTEFNIFAIADALAKSDRKKLWLLLMKSFQEGISPENIAGVLSWKARTALAGARTPAERKKFQKISRDLVCMYHDSHRGAGELGLLLERFALTL